MVWPISGSGLQWGVSYRSGLDCGGGHIFQKRKEKRHLGFRLYTLGVSWIIIFYASRLKIQLFEKNLPKIMGGGGGNT